MCLVGAEERGEGGEGSPRMQEGGVALLTAGHTELYLILLGCFSLPAFRSFERGAFILH